MRRKRAERLNQIQTGTPAQSTTNAPMMRREFSSTKSECVQIPSATIETY